MYDKDTWIFIYNNLYHSSTIIMQTHMQVYLWSDTTFIHIMHIIIMWCITPELNYALCNVVLIHKGTCKIGVSACAYNKPIARP